MSSDLESWEVTEPFLRINCNLGEGPHYEPATNTLRFVDIIEKALHTVSLTEGPSSLKTLTLPFSIGSTADIEGIDPSKKILVGSKSGVGILDRETGELELLKKYYDGEDPIEKTEVLGDGVKEERMRGNDGSVDPQGRFWIGTMTDFWVGDVFDEGAWKAQSDVENLRLRFLHLNSRLDA
jgi:sugar lactone lactonase YvrE